MQRDAAPKPVGPAANTGMALCLFKDARILATREHDTRGFIAKNPIGIF